MQSHILSDILSEGYCLMTLSAFCTITTLNKITSQVTTLTEFLHTSIKQCQHSFFFPSLGMSFLEATKLCYRIFFIFLIVIRLFIDVDSKNIFSGVGPNIFFGFRYCSFYADWMLGKSWKQSHCVFGSCGGKEITGLHTKVEYSVLF